MKVRDILMEQPKTGEEVLIGLKEKDPTTIQFAQQLGVPPAVIEKFGQLEREKDQIQNRKVGIEIEKLEDAFGAFLKKAMKPKLKVGRRGFMKGALNFVNFLSNIDTILSAIAKLPATDRIVPGEPLPASFWQNAKRVDPPASSFDFIKWIKAIKKEDEEEDLYSTYIDIVDRAADLDTKWSNAPTLKNLKVAANEAGVDFNKLVIWHVDQYFENWIASYQDDHGGYSPTKSDIVKRLQRLAKRYKINPDELLLFYKDEVDQGEEEDQDWDDE